MAKVAVALEQALELRATHGTAGFPSARVVAAGEGWVVEDVVCTAGPDDRVYEEQHSHVRVAIVAAGTFQYRADCHGGAARALMTPGSVLLAAHGQCFECNHDHSTGDRCLSFGYTPEYFERLTGDDGRHGRHVVRLPPLRALSPFIARACAGVTGDAAVAWEELSIELGARVVRLSDGYSRTEADIPSAALKRVASIVRHIERHPDTTLTLERLAREASVSPYHFLRTFERIAGVTPHQYVLRTRLREAASRLLDEPQKILEIALDCGFADVSNFNHAFRAEFGVSPREFRRASQPVP